MGTVLATLRRLTLAAAATTAGLGGAQADTAPPPNADEQDFPVIITPTRLRQPVSEVPASVTVITADMLQRHGVTSLPEALRLVPGMLVTRATANNYKINYHGTNSLDPRRMNVLIDGVAAYKPGLSRVDWQMLPVPLDDIERIEVTRGPSSAAHGPNSMMAVINILTRHPRDVDKVTVSGQVDSRGNSTAGLRMSWSLSRTQVYASVQEERSSGYDYSTSHGPTDDNATFRRLHVRMQTEGPGGQTLEGRLGLTEALRPSGQIEPFQTSSPTNHTTNAQASLRWIRPLSADHELQVTLSAAENRGRERWRTCVPRGLFLPEVLTLLRTNATYIVQALQLQFPTGGSPEDDLLAQQALQAILNMGVDTALNPFCGIANNDYDEARVQLELEDTLVLSDRVRLVGGLGLRHIRATSDTLLGGSATNAVNWLFGHGEFRLRPDLIANVGGYYESSALGGDTFSPRMGLNWHLDDRQTLRIAYAEGTRSPDLLELRARWSYTLQDIEPNAAPLDFAPTIPLYTSDGKVRSERMRSTEIGYLHSLPAWGLTLDSRLFHERMSDLIITYVPFGDRSANAGKLNAVQLSGLETQIGWSPTSDWWGFLNYSYLVNHDATSTLERQQYSRHSGAIGLGRRLPLGWQASLTHYAASGDGVAESRFGRTDAHVSRHWRWGTSPAQAGLTLSYMDPPEVQDYRPVLGPQRAGYDSGFSVQGRVSVGF